MEVEDNRTGSADSENGSSDSYVQVSREDAQVSDQIAENQPDVNREEELDTFNEEQLEDSGVPEKPEVEEEDVVAPSSETLEEGKVESSSIEEIPVVKESENKQKQCSRATGLLRFLNVLHPGVLYVIYWKDPKLSAVVLGGVLVTLLTLTLNTFIHTVVLFLLSFMVVSLTYIVVKIAMDSFYNRPIKNPFSDYLSKRIVLPRDKVVEWSEFIVNELNCTFNTVARLVMFDNIKSTFKFGISLWLLSFITNYVTLLRALFFAVVFLFAVPPIYSRHQAVIDRTVGQVRETIITNVRRVGSRIPYLKEKLQ